MNQLPTPQSKSNISQIVSPQFQSFRSINSKITMNTILQNINLQQAQQVSKMKSPKQISQISHSHKNSQVDISQLTKLMKQNQQKVQNVYISQNELNSVLSQSNLILETSNAKIAAIQAKAKELTTNFKLKSPTNSATQSLSHTRNGSGSDNNSFKSVGQGLQQILKSQQPFLNYIHLKDIQHKTHQTTTTNQEDDKKIEKDIKQQFNFLFVIGIGGFGKVWKVEIKKKGITYAMKEMSKALVITKKSVTSVMNERQLLSNLKHPFLVNMHYAFQDRENIFLVMDYMLGGDLRYHIGKMRRLNEETTKFFIACIFIGLEYLHNNNIIQRDIKPENLVLDDKGYVRITDLGIARILKTENSADTSGTPGYMAPEVMCRQNHTFAVDYFALGVIAYEFMMGRRPYVGRSRQEIRDQILAKQVQLKKTDIPEGWTVEAADFINKLIQRKPANRLGFYGSQEIRLHPWFNKFPWSKLQSKELKAPFIPNQNDDNFDKKQIFIEDEENAELIQQNALLLRDDGVQELFLGYEFNNMSSSTTTKQSSGSSIGNHIHTYSSISSK